jgi:type IV pilus assembly protein PilB
MPSATPGNPTVAVIGNVDQLDAYLVACAAGRPEPALAGLQVAQAAWRERAGDGGMAAWEHAHRLGLPLVDTARVAAEPGLGKHFPDAAGRRLRATALRSAHGYLAVAVEPGSDEAIVSTLGFVANLPIAPMVASEHAGDEHGSPQDDLDEDQRIARQMGLEPGRAAQERSRHDSELASRWTMIRAMRETLSAAVRQRASDVHIRPGASDFELLFRIDGNMVPQRHIIPEVAALVINRIKVFAQLDIAEHRRPQDGRGTFKLDDGRSIDLRVSVVPSVLGESVVVRLLDTEESLKTIEQIQLSPADRAELDDQMARSHGFFLVTGPTGCGKSTTLYAMLQALRRQPINILTVEDPVEYTLAGIRQMEVNPRIDVTFSNALRSFLRHDPDVIMVGEIRDRETAGMAVESALTGHLVLSTLHTNTAATTVTRLLELGVEAYLLRAALTGIMAQRLVRLTCEHCRTPEEPAPAIRSALGVGPDEEFTTGRGCARCHGTGVFRRSAVYELMRITPAIRALIEPGVDADRMHAAALADGMVPITEAALRMARQGRISLAEAYRVRAD